MRVSLLDHGLRRRTGHHFDLTLGLARRLLRNGHATEVHGHRRADPEVGAAFSSEGIAFHRSFSGSVQSPSQYGPEAGSAWQRQLEQTAGELQPAVNADLCLFPTLTADLLAAYTALASPPNMIGLVHQLPEQKHPNAQSSWAAACEQARCRRLPVHLAAIDPLLGEALRPGSGGLPILDLPVPIGAVPRASVPVALRRVGFFGHQRPERGSHLLPALVQGLLDLGFEVTVHDSRGRIRSDAPHPRLRLLGAFVEDLGAVLRECDLVVCPMDPSRYDLRVSGIALHALACGVPFLAPAGTLCLRRWEATGCCAAFKEGSPASILAAVLAAAGAYPALAQAAAREALAWNAANGEGRFLEAALAAAGLAASG